MIEPKVCPRCAELNLASKKANDAYVATFVHGTYSANLKQKTERIRLIKLRSSLSTAYNLHCQEPH